jgi:hypothetical protein
MAARRIQIALLATLALALAGLVGPLAAGAAGRAPVAKAMAAPALPDVRGVGDAASLGSTSTVAGNQPIVGIARTASSAGYWEAAVDGGVFAFGDAAFHGSMGGVRLNQPVVGIAAAPTGNGYWLAANDGGVFAFGDAGFHGSTGALRLNQPVVGIAATPTGNGYWLAASDGGVFAFGDAKFLGSMGGAHINRPVVGIAATKTGKGYWLAASDGGIFAFGDAGFFGSLGGVDRPIAAFAARPQSDGYWLVSTDGWIYAYGAKGGLGGRVAGAMTQPVTAVAATSSGTGLWLAGRGTVPIYLVRGEKVGAATRDVRGADPLKTVVADLLAGPTATERAAGLGTAIPTGTTVRSVSVAGKVATVDLTGQFITGGGSLSMLLRTAQVVFTLTGLPGIDRVAFSIDGNHVITIGAEGVMVDPNVGRVDFADFEPQVLVDTPAPGDLVTSPLWITGAINSFEGVATFDLYTAGGRLLAHTIGMGEMGQWRPFSTPLAFQAAGETTGTLVARPTQGKEGIPPADAVIPVRFRP